MEPAVVLQARNSTIGDLVEQCAKGEIGFDVLCRRVSEMGYKTTMLYEMVYGAESAIRSSPATED